MVGRVVHPLMKLSDRWPRASHIRLVSRMKFAHFKQLFFEWWGSWCFLVNPILPFFLPLSVRSPDMTEILLNWTSSVNSINQRVLTESRT